MLLSRFSCLVVLVSLLLGVSSAWAETELTIRGAAGIPTSNFSMIKTPSPMAAGDLTFGMSDMLQVGATYDHNWLSYNGGGTGTENFYGAILRVGTFMGPFADGQAGLCERDGSGTSFSFGVGLGYAIPMSPFIDFSPRFGYRSLPDNATTRSMVDFGAQVTFRLF